MCPILDGYGVMTVFLIPVHGLVWTAFTAGGVMDSRYLDTWEGCGEGGGGLVTRAVHNRGAACVAAGGGIFENQL